MDYLAKTCPHCKVPLRSGEGAFELSRRGVPSSSESARLPVSLYYCPQCGFIELYNLKVVGRL